VNRQTVNLTYILGEYRATTAFVATTTQGMGLSLSQPVTQGPCQMSCENPLGASISCAGSSEVQRETWWTGGYSKHLPAARKLSSAPNGW